MIRVGVRGSRFAARGEMESPLRVPWETQVQPLVLHAAPVRWREEGEELRLQTPFYRP